MISSLQGRCDEDYGANFVYSLHQKELIVGDIFVRIYNEQPTYPIEVCCTSICIMYNNLEIKSPYKDIKI